ncbi:carboxysome structural protein EutK [Salmonella enterica subsp. enterica serovar Enteritidis str. 22558]|nr:carboxysome structural protein EutK [Salmonella enterica subsp. enterica serovar Enteritidis str. 22558]
MADWRVARATTPTEKAPQAPATPEFAEALLALLASVRQGMTAGEVAAHLAGRWSRPETCWNNSF